MLIACVAPGPSLTAEMCSQLAGRCRVLVINNAFELCPWADWLYACDGAWWDEFHQDVARNFQGERWTQDLDAALEYGLKHIELAPRPERFSGLSIDPRFIKGGYTSGYQAINLAYHLGASRILLVGYDMRPINGQTHFFGEYLSPRLARSSRRFDKFARAFDTIDPKKYGVEIFNCTPGSAITAFPHRSLQEGLCH